MATDKTQWQKNKMALQEPFTAWITQGLNTTSLASSALPSWVQWGAESKLLTNGKMVPVGRALVKMCCAEHPQLCRGVHTSEKTTSTRWSHPLGSHGIGIGWPKTTRKWVGGMWQAIQGERSSAYISAFFSLFCSRDLPSFWFTSLGREWCSHKNNGNSCAPQSNPTKVL